MIMLLQEYITDIAAGPFGSNLKVSCFVEKGFPIIDGANLKGYKVTDNITKFVTEEKARSLHRSIAKRGDIVVTISGNVGQISYIPDDSEYEEYLVSQRQFRATFDRDRVNVAFLVYYFHTREGQHKILSFANQVGVPALAQPLKNFKNISIELPSKDRQDAIAAYIDNIEDKIAINHRICENLEAQAQALFKHWFIDFAPFKDGKFVESEFGMIPDEWRVGRADDFYTINIGKTPPRAERQWFSEQKENNIIWISISDMGNCSAFISDSKEYITTEAQSRFNVQMVPVGSVLLSFKLTLGRVAIADAELTTNEAIARFFLPNPDYREYTYLYLKQFKYGSLGSTSSIATAVNSKIIKAMPFLMPSEDIMKSFSEISGPLFDEIKNLNQETTNLATLRDTLLPKLMSGQIKL